MRESVAVVHHLASRFSPVDEVGAEDRASALAWLGLGDAGLSQSPIFLTITRTVGRHHGHRDVSLWYVSPYGGETLATAPAETAVVRAAEIVASWED